MNLVDAFDRIAGKEQSAQNKVLKKILCGVTSINSAGFPYISEETYRLLLSRVPHLFSNGLELLEFINDMDAKLKEENLSTDELNSFGRATKVLKNIILTASVTAPTDLWLLKRILSTFYKLGLSQEILKGEKFCVSEMAKKFKLDEPQLLLDLKFLYSRGYLDRENEIYSLKDNLNATAVFKEMTEIDEETTDINRVHSFISFFNGELETRQFENLFKNMGTSSSATNWVATPNDIELGYRLVPMVLALRSLDLTHYCKEGDRIFERIPQKVENLKEFLLKAGIIDAEEKITFLGERVFERGPGPFGIIQTYFQYLTHHEDLLTGKKTETWVSRGENVAASQDANRKTFLLANKALDQFCIDKNFTYSTFIEHAVGQGEASRQRFEMSPNNKIQFFGADLEQEAINKALEAQKRGELPENMKFIANVDIGEPQLLIDSIKNLGFSAFGAVMIVGNGFHEIRNQTNESMIQVFKKYHDAGIIILFTEESGLMDEDLVDTAWNTYHAGFKYVHGISGQGLRPAIDNEEQTQKFSWAKCAELGGYNVVEKYTTRTRKIYPHPKSNGYNPAISVNYFCVPKNINC